MAYAAWSVIAGEQPTTSKWNILGTNDSSFNDGTGIGTSVIGNSALAIGTPVQMVSLATNAVATGTTILPFDDTPPQNTEGDQYMSLAIAPKSATNTLVIQSVVQLSASVARYMSAALFQDATLSALAANSQFATTGTSPSQVVLQHAMVAGTTSATTFKIRAGGDGAATTTFNGAAGARLFNTLTKSSLVITEYKS